MDLDLSYYPGCSLHGTAEEYDSSTRALCEMLGIRLHELDDWTCCGASSAHSVSKQAAVLLPARNLALAEQSGRDLLIPCAACYGRSKSAQIALEKDSALQTAYTETFGAPHPAGVPIRSMIDLLAEPDALEEIGQRVKKPLTGLKLASYYGCLLVRPAKVTGVKDYEAPQGMDRVIAKLGATSVPWSYKTDCCGGGLAIGRPDLVVKLADDLLTRAVEAGADAIVTACPMCQANLDTRQDEAARAFGREHKLPVFFVSELVALAFEHAGTGAWWRKHLTDPRPLLRTKELM